MHPNHPAHPNHPSRRAFLAASALTALASGLSLPAHAWQPAAGATAPKMPGDQPRKGPVVVASFNGKAATARAMELLKAGYDPADAVVQGVRIMEDDPEDDSVGYGGLPNEEGIVELDACVMHGPTHKTGAVMSLRNIKNPAMVALEVLRRTDHCQLVGEGALRFAVKMGFKEENLLTEKSRLEWLKWKSELAKRDNWLNEDERDAPAGKTWVEPGLHGEKRAALDAAQSRAVQYRTGTVHCSALTEAGDIASTTSTSGLSWKIPGRVGDSPIIGAGNYCDNAIGAAGATGRGEAAIVNCAAFDIVQKMAQGMTPTEAALAVVKRMAEHCAKEKRHRKPDGNPDFNIRVYALRKDGAHGAASLFKTDDEWNSRYSVCDAAGPRLEPCAALFEAK